MNDTQLVSSQLTRAVRSLNQTLETIIEPCGPGLAEAVALSCRALRNRNKILFFGNGGSATQAQHLAAELINRFQLERQPLPALSLTPDAAVITSIGNDYSFAELFSRQLIGLGQPGDIAVALSTSGTSENIVAGLKQARTSGLTTIGLLGRDGGNCLEFCDISLLVPAAETARIQEAHLLLGHLFCELVEKEMSANPE